VINTAVVDFMTGGYSKAGSSGADHGPRNARSFLNQTSLWEKPG
jgi:hypothetical protein